MKKITILGCMAIVCAAIAGTWLTGENKTGKSASNLAILNIESMSVAAWTAECDATTSSECQIYGVGAGTGRLITP